MSKNEDVKVIKTYKVSSLSQYVPGGGWGEIGVGGTEGIGGAEATIERKEYVSISLIETNSGNNDTIILERPQLKKLGVTIGDELYAIFQTKKITT